MDELLLSLAVDMARFGLQRMYDSHVARSGGKVHDLTDGRSVSASLKVTFRAETNEIPFWVLLGMQRDGGRPIEVPVKYGDPPLRLVVQRGFYSIIALFLSRPFFSGMPPRLLGLAVMYQDAISEKEQGLSLVGKYPSQGQIEWLDSKMPAPKRPFLLPTG